MQPLVRSLPQLLGWTDIPPAPPRNVLTTDAVQSGLKQLQGRLTELRDQAGADDIERLLLTLFCHPQPYLCLDLDDAHPLLGWIDGTIARLRTRPWFIPGTKATWDSTTERWHEIVHFAAVGYRHLTALPMAQRQAMLSWFSTRLPGRRRYEWLLTIAIGVQAGTVAEIYLQTRGEQPTPERGVLLREIAQKLRNGPAITPLLPAENLVTWLDQRLDIVDERTFAGHYYHAFGIVDDDRVRDGTYLLNLWEVDGAGGFSANTTSGTYRMYLPQFGGTVDNGVHEALHLLSPPGFAEALAAFLDEGVVEHLTRRFCGPTRSFDGWRYYPFSRRVIATLVRDRALTDDDVLQAYVRNEPATILGAIRQHGGEKALAVLRSDRKPDHAPVIFHSWCVEVARQRGIAWQPVDRPAADRLAEQFDALLAEPPAPEDCVVQ